MKKIALKKRILELLGDNFKPSDEELIEELVFNFELVKLAKEGIMSGGLMINTVRNPERDPYYQKSPYVGIYDTALKNVQNLYSKLNIAPTDRKDWAKEVEVDDGFDKDFNN